MPDVITIGEALIDFVPVTAGTGLAETQTFEKRPGGAPANVAVGVARLGGSAGFIGKLGRDDFGRFLWQTLSQNGVDTTGVVFTDEARTALAFVTLREDGEREFIFYRDSCADVLLDPDEINPAYIRSARIVHFGTVSLISEPARSATYWTVDLARNACKLVSLDVNLREPLWPSSAAARQEILTAAKAANIVKVSAEELTFMFGNLPSLSQGAEQLLNLGPALVLVTLGPDGCYARSRNAEVKVPGIRVGAMDTTGAGDAFTAAVLTRLVEMGLKKAGDIACLSEDSLQEICFFANVTAALTCTRKGAISALPFRSEVEDRIKMRVKNG